MNPRTRHFLAPLGIFVFTAAVIVLLYATRERVEVVVPEPVVPLVHAQVVRAEPMELRVQAQGTVVPRTESDLIPQVSGEVVWVSPALATGGFFEAGEPLVRIETVDYEANLESARAEVARRASEAKRARKEVDRQHRLADRSVASEARIDEAENADHIAAAELRGALARRSQAERNLERTVLTAPYTGRVRTEHIDAGQFVSRGQSIARLYAVDFAEVPLPVPDREMGFLDLPPSYLGVPQAESDLGPEVTLRAEFAGIQHEWSGRLVRTEGALDPKSRMVRVVARVKDPYHRASPGMQMPLAVGLFVDAEIRGRRLPKAVVLPRTAVSDSGRVLVIGSDGHVAFRNVTVVRAERDRVIIGEGLENGERVVVTPMPGAVDGMAVRVVGDAEPIARAEP